jgi:hypothetical protein
VSRPTQKEIAAARAKAQWFVATAPHHSMVAALKTLIAATAPPMQGDVILEAHDDETA